MYSAVLQDIKASIKHWPFWLYMAWFEIKISYRGSKLGPFWITISMAIFVISMSVVYTKLFHQNINQYLPFLLCGFLIWYLISNVVTRSCDIFTGASSFITQMKIPFFVYIFKHLAKEIITYGHNFVVYLALLIILKINPGWIVVLAIPGLLLVMLNLLWVVMLVGLISARYRDLPPIIASIVQIAFFISPITWMPKLLGDNSIVIKYNPVTYLLEVVRDPLLGIMPPVHSWIILIGMFICGILVILPFFAKYMIRIPFWVL